MKPWTRNDTKEWIIQLEHRIQDIDYYLDKAGEWCDEYGIDNNNLIFMCSFLTCVWVSNMRGEPITFNELMEILGVDEWNDDEEKYYELDECWGSLDFHEFLEKVVQTYSEDDDYE
jgi:hypothetical protein